MPEAKIFFSNIFNYGLRALDTWEDLKEFDSRFQNIKFVSCKKVKMSEYRVWSLEVVWEPPKEEKD